jgi:S-adenosylmethionine:tRNA ribosyltransferase-isomerase
LLLSDFDFVLPDELIAQTPAAERGASRLLTLDRTTGACSDHRFRDLPALVEPGDLLVVNDTKVFAARLLGRRLPGGGQAECLLVRRLDAGPDGERWEALVHPGQRLKEGSRLEFGDAAHRLHGEICARRFHGRRVVRLWSESESVSELVDRLGHVPLPPYIKRPDEPADRDRYQTVYARSRGSIAAPTAGLHFTPEVLAALDARGVERVAITLHVGYGTFQPIRSARVEDHQMETERYEVSAAAADAITRARRERRRVIAVGTTSVRTLESLPVAADGGVAASEGSTGLYIVPGHQFRIVSGLLSNFHLPRSSLLLLVSAFAGRDHVLAAYNHAIQERYRFYSYGDAMLIR